MCNGDKIESRIHKRTENRTALNYLIAHHMLIPVRVYILRHRRKTVFQLRQNTVRVRPPEQRP